MRIDCQSHVFPSAYLDILARNPQLPRVERDGNEFIVTYGDIQQFRLRQEMYDPRRKLQDMDKAGIDLSILSTNMPGPCMLVPELALEGARAINDSLAEMVHHHPDRFAALASLPWQEPDSAAREMDRVQDELGFCGIVLYSHIGGRPVDDPAFEPLYARAEAKSLPIVLHPTVPVWGETIKDYWMIPMIGLQVDTSFALLRLLLGGVMERHPRLQIVMPHVGGVLPYMMGRIDHQTEAMGRGREHITQSPSQYMRRVYLDTVSPSAQALRYAYEFSGAEHLVFGTDHPWIDPQLFVELIAGMDISTEEREQIFAGNARALFNLRL